MKNIMIKLVVNMFGFIISIEIILAPANRIKGINDKFANIKFFF